MWDRIEIGLTKIDTRSMALRPPTVNNIDKNFQLPPPQVNHELTFFQNDEGYERGEAEKEVNWCRDTCRSKV